MSKKYVISLGRNCHTAGLIKINNLKLFSFQFDWIFSDISMYNFFTINYICKIIVMKINKCYITKNK